MERPRLPLKKIKKMIRHEIVGFEDGDSPLASHRDLNGNFPVSVFKARAARGLGARVLISGPLFRTH